MIKKLFGLVLAILILCGLCGASLAIIDFAWGHSWYEPACCSGHDCKPVNQEDLEELSGGCWRYIPMDLKFCGPQVRPSQDSKWHVCYREVKVLGSTKQPYCVYIQNGT